MTEFDCTDCGDHVFDVGPIYLASEKRCQRCRFIRSIEPQYREEAWARFRHVYPEIGDMPASLRDAQVSPLYPVGSLIDAAVHFWEQRGITLTRDQARRLISNAMEFHALVSSWQTQGLRAAAAESMAVFVGALKP